MQHPGPPHPLWSPPIQRARYPMHPLCPSPTGIQLARHTDGYHTQPSALMYPLFFLILMLFRACLLTGSVETTQKVSASTVALGNRRLKGECTEGTSSRLRRYSHWLRWGKTKRTKLEFSGWDLRPYILLLLYVHVCIGSTDDCSRVFQILVA